MSEYSELSDKINRLEILYNQLKGMMDLVAPKELIEFQAETVQALKTVATDMKSLKEDFNSYKEERDKAVNRRITWGISIAALILVALQMVLKLT